MKLLLPLLLLVIVFPLIVYPQVDSSAAITEDILENILVEPEEESNAEELVNIFEDLINNPIDLNSADIIELTNLPEMDLQSAQNIIDHRNKFGYFYSTNELFSIRDLDKSLIERILPFITTVKGIDKLEQIGETTESTESFFSKSKIKLRSRITNDLQERAGFIDNKFRGSKIKLYNRILFNQDKQLSGWLFN